MINVAINGFGRIGRAAFKIISQRQDIRVVAINDMMDNPTLAHLLKHDTVYGDFNQVVAPTKEGIKVGETVYPVFAEKDPAKLPWDKLQVDVVLECTGRFTDKQSASAHLTAGAKKVIISAPAKDDTTQTLVCGTHHSYDIIAANTSDVVVSNASCTTNCIAPVMQVLETRFGIAKAMMTTVHSYTADQTLVDGPHRDLRRARAAAQNIIPTSTGAAIATTEVIPGLKNNFDGISIRVPTICVSVSDITALLKTETVTVEEINKEFKKAATQPLFKDILAVTEEPLVSSDFKGNHYSAIVDLEFTRVVGGNLVKILAWYDNEWGYTHRLIDMAVILGQAIKH